MVPFPLNLVFYREKDLPFSSGILPGFYRITPVFGQADHVFQSGIVVNQNFYLLCTLFKCGFCFENRQGTTQTPGIYTLFQAEYLLLISFYSGRLGLPAGPSDENTDQNPYEYNDFSI